MRILLNLKATKDFFYDKNYFHKLQGFVYSLLKDTPLSILHDKKGYKFFTFSNIFPLPKEGLDVKNEELKKLIISSPSSIFIKILEEKLKEKMEKKEKIHIGEMEFEIEKVKVFRIKLRNNLRLISATPIIIRIPEKNYEKYKIPKEFRKKRYVYWRPQYSFEAFVKQLEENLIKKYKEFYKENFQIDGIFEGFKFLKGPIVNHVIINGKEQIFVGSLWEFWFSYLSKEKKKLLEFGIDCGFGERNSLGFGFINILENI